MIVVFSLNGTCQRNIQTLTFMLSAVCFCCCLGIWLTFDNTNLSYQFITIGVFHFELIQTFTYSFCFGIDGISVFFIILTTFLIPLCILTS
jgi:NADH-quinone oxidoreductase subunit M